MERTAVLIIVITALFSGFACAQSKPDFTGTWTLDMARSDMGQSRPATPPGARKITLVIRQTPALLTIERKAGDRIETATFKLDGSESVNKSPSGQDIKSFCRWSGSTLVTTSTMAAGEMTAEVSDVRSLSADGKVMTIDVTRKTPRGNVKQNLVYARQ